VVFICQGDALRQGFRDVPEGQLQGSIFYAKKFGGGHMYRFKIKEMPSALTALF
jgi:hypothetical protein